MKKNYCHFLNQVSVKTVLVLVCFLSTRLIAQPSFSLARSFGGTTSCLGNSIATDASGNVYSTGSFGVNVGSTVDFNPGPGVNTMSSAGGTDVYISKLDASGNYVWAKRIGGTGGDVGQEVVVDAAGNVLTIGSFRGSVDFDPGAGTFSLSSSSTIDDDIFISKLDASGNFVWARRIGNTGMDFGYSIAVDASGNVYTTGAFQNSVDFDPGAGSFSLTATGGFDIFISKLNPAGNFVWAKQIGGTGSDRGYGISVDATGNVFTTGAFSAPSPVDFDPGPSVFNLIFGGLYVNKLDASGNFVWAKEMLGGSSAGMSVALDGTGNVYVGGQNPGVYFAKLDPNGALLWSKNPGGSTGNNACMDIAVDALGNLYTTGYFINVVDFSGTGICNLTAGGLEDFFVCKYDTYGNFACGGSMGLGASDVSNSIALDPSGNTLTTGQFQLTVDFDPGAGTYTLTSSTLDAFVCKLGNTCATIAPSPLVSNITCNGAANGSASVSTNGGNGGPYTYSWSTSPVQTTSVASGLNVGTYTCFVNDGVSPTATVAVSITQPPLLVVNAGINTSMCTGTCTTIGGSPATASGGSFPYAYLWMPGAYTSASVAVCPSVTTSYTCTVTDAKGCIKTAIKTVSVNPLPAINIASTSNSVCLGSALTLTAQGANTYTWSTGAMTNIISVSPLTITNYTLTGKDLNNCMNSSSVTISVNSLPSVSVTGSGTVCSGSPITLSASGANTYSWSTGATSNSITVNPVTSLSYSVTGTDVNGCNGVAAKSVSVFSLPSVIITGNSSVCFGDSVLLTASGALSYVWNTSAVTTTLAVSPVANTTYSVVGTAANTCTNVALKTITVNPLPTILASSTSSLMCVGQTATLNASGANSYTWSTGATNASVTISPTTTTSYTLTGIDINGCSDTTIITQSVSLCTTIEALTYSEGALTVFPNPFNETFVLRFPGLNLSEIEIYSVSGSLLRKELNVDPSNSSVEISMAQQTNGIYFLRLITLEGKTILKKIMKE